MLFKEALNSGAPLADPAFRFSYITPSLLFGVFCPLFPFTSLFTFDLYIHQMPVQIVNFINEKSDFKKTLAAMTRSVLLYKIRIQPEPIPELSDVPF